MDIAGGPAAFGGMMMSLALAAWSLGRWQGGLVTGEDCDAAAPGAVKEASAAGSAGFHPSSVPATPCQDAARAERSVALASATSLGEIHAEISAYRRAERVLSDLKDDPLSLTGKRHAGQAGCRYIGIVGTPTCGVPEAARLANACGTGRHPAQRTQQSARAV
ncbi:MAG: hypothetical protein O9293_13900 [Porphyrobacter sp.]|nr:hypothetical protein [Porphyrobacter sp.]